MIRISKQEALPTRQTWKHALQSLAICAVAWISMETPLAAQVVLPELPHIDWEQRLGQQVPMTIALSDSDGTKTSLAELLDDRPVVLALVYYECPMLCNLVLEGLTKSLGDVAFDAGDEFEVLVVSIDPGETVQMAQDRKQKYLDAGMLSGRPEGWHFLVGAEEEVMALAQAVGFGYTYIPETDEYAHPAGVTILTPEGVVSSVLFGVDFSPRDLKFALMEASEGSIGSPVDKVLLRCFAYDPSSGKYGFAVMTTIRIAGIGTLGLLALFTLRALRRERRSKSTQAVDARTRVSAS